MMFLSALFLLAALFFLTLADVESKQSERNRKDLQKLKEKLGVKEGE